MLSNSESKYIFYDTLQPRDNKMNGIPRTAAASHVMPL